MHYVEPIRDREKIANIKCYLKEHSMRDYLIFLIGINTGLRISDILSLKVNNVKNKDYLELIEKKTKKYRKIPISNYIKSELDNYIKCKKENDWLFASQRYCGKNAISRIQAYRIIKSACEKVGVNVKIGTHTMRKTFGYHFYYEKKDVALLQNILNHASPSITMRYIGINQDMIDSGLKDFLL